MELSSFNDDIPDSLNIFEMNNLLGMSAVDNVIADSQNADTYNVMGMFDDDAVPDFVHVVGTNDLVEDDSFSNSHETLDTNHAAENIPASIKPPRKKKKKRENGHLGIKRRVRKYLGMKAHELRPILQSDALKFCQQYNLLAPSAMCSCGEKMYLSPNKHISDGFSWYCSKIHKSRLTVRKGSWFEHSKLPLSECLWIIYMWVYQYSFISMAHETDVSGGSLIEWCNSCRDACQLILKSKRDPIGGPDKIVEIFEAKFKNSQKSKQKEGEDGSEQWIFIGLEHFSAKCVFIVVPNKKSDTLFDIFDEYILMGTKVFSHVWNAYVDLDIDSYDYLTKEKLLVFHDSETKTDMDTFKKFQNVAKRPRPGLNYYNKYEYSADFCEYMYRKILSSAPDAYFAFLKDIASIYELEGGVRKEQPTPKTEKNDS